MEFYIKSSPIGFLVGTILFLYFFRKHMIVDYASEKCDSEQMFAMVVDHFRLTHDRSSSKISGFLWFSEYFKR